MHTLIYSLRNKEKILMTVQVLIPVTGHVSIAGIYNNLLAPFILYSFCPQQAPQLVVVLSLVE